MSERFILCIFALIVLCCVLFSGEPDIVDALRGIVENAARGCVE